MCSRFATTRPSAPPCPRCRLYAVGLRWDAFAAAGLARPAPRRWGTIRGTNLSKTQKHSAAQDAANIGFLEAMDPLAHEVLAVLVNRRGDEFTLAWPKRASHEVHERVMTLFFANDRDRWTQTPYEEQSPSVCVAGEPVCSDLGVSDPLA